MDNKEINAVAGPETTDQISQAVWDVAHRGGEPYPNVRYSQKTGASINNENIDPWVWETTAEMMGGLDRDGNARKWSLAQKEGDEKVAAAEGEAKTEEKAAEGEGEKKQQNQYATGAVAGGANSEPEKVHILHTPIAKTHTTFYLGKGKRDIAEAGMEPNTHMFANDNVDTVNAPVGSVGIPNGSQAGWIGTASRTRDMADPGGFEPNVLAFSNPQVDVLNAEKKSSWIPNGAQSGWSLAQKDRQDIAEPGMEPNTHMFSNDNVDALNAAKNHGPWVPNGSRAGWIQKYKRDIGEVGMEPNTHMFANDNVDTVNAPLGSVGIPNGSQAGWMAKGKRDISDKDVDEEVHGFASADTNVLPYAHSRPDSAPLDNGSGLAQRMDIANTEVRPDVYHTVVNNDAVSPW
jgi:hypothetical protein